MLGHQAILHHSAHAVYCGFTLGERVRLSLFASSLPSNDPIWPTFLSHTNIPLFFSIFHLYSRIRLFPWPFLSLWYIHQSLVFMAVSSTPSSPFMLNLSSNLIFQPPSSPILGPARLLQYYPHLPFDTNVSLQMLVIVKPLTVSFKIVSGMNKITALVMNLWIVK